MSYPEADMAALKEEWRKLNESLGNLEKTSILVDRFLYSNVKPAFGKYEYQVKQEQNYVYIYMEKGEI